MLGRIASVDEEHGKCSDVVIPRQDLLDKNERSDTLELRLSQQQDEFQYQLGQVNAVHDAEISRLRNEFGAQIEQLKKTNHQLERKHLEELNILTVSIAQTKDEHCKTMADLESHLNEKMIVEFDKSTSIKKKMDDMKEDYEKLLRKSAGCLDDTIVSLESDFKLKLQESQDMIRDLMKEIECKKSEFVLYCQQLNVDNDRRMIEMKIEYEKKLKIETELMQKWRADAGVLNKKLSVSSINGNNLEQELSILKREHVNNKKIIRQVEQDLEEARREVRENGQYLDDKNMCFEELQTKYSTLEKYRDMLRQKISELQSEMGPKDKDVQDKKYQIIDMESELQKVEASNVKLQLTVNQLKEKYHAINVELKAERSKYLALRSQVSQICCDIYNASRSIQNIPKLKEQVVTLYRK